jgi:hypothetical protein
MAHPIAQPWTGDGMTAKRASCCAGHTCDRCETCRAGSCCQMDAAPYEAWDNLAISPRLFFLPLAELQTVEGLSARVFNPIRRAFWGSESAGGLGALLLMNSDLLVGRTRTIGPLGLRALVDALGTIEKREGREDVGDQAIQQRARALAQFAYEFSFTWEEPRTVHYTTGRVVTYMDKNGCDFKAANRYARLGAAARRAGALTNATVYERAAELVQMGNLGIKPVAIDPAASEPPALIEPKSPVIFDKLAAQLEQPGSAARLLLELKRDPVFRAEIFAALGII